MKQTWKSLPVLVLPLLLVSFVLGPCGDANSRALGAVAENPLVFEDTLRDIGDIPQGQIAEVEFTYQCGKEVALDDLSVQTYCNCAAADIEATALKNKTTGSIVLRIDTSRRFRATRNTATVLYRSNDKVFKQQLTVIANVFADGKVVANVPAIDLGKRTPGETVNEHLLLKRLGSKAFETKVNSIQCPSWISIRTLVKDPNEFKWHVNLVTEIPNKYGLLQDYLHVHTNDPDFPTTEVPILCIVEKPVTAKPSRILRCLSADHAAESFRILIDDKYKREIDITGVTFDKGEEGFTVTVNKEENSVDVTYRGISGSRTSLRDVARIHLDIGGEQEAVDVPILLLLKS